MHKIHSMKKIILFFLIVIPIALFSKNSTEGSIKYQITYKEAKETLLQLVLLDSLSNDTITNSIEIACVNQQDSSIKENVLVYDYEKMNQPISFIPALYTFKNSGCKVSNVDIKKNKLNCVTLFISRGTVAFLYSLTDTARVDLEAKMMFQQYDPQHAMLQDCKKIGNYQSGNYFIEINTFPVSKKRLKVEAGQINTIVIEKPGKLIINKPTSISALKIFENKFRTWRENKELDLNSKASYNLTIQPGNYKFTWIENNTQKESMIVIQSNQTENLLFSK